MNGTLKGTLVMLSLVLLFSSCSKKIAFLNSPVVPGADGTVYVKQDNNKNYSIDLVVNNLAEPDRLTPPKKLYVVWIETSQNGVQKLGQLKTSTKGFSKMMTSSLQTVTAYKPNSLFITAEDESTGNYPGMVVVLKTAAFAIK